MKFQLDLGEILEVNRVLFVLGMKVSRLSMSSLEDDGYGFFDRTNVSLSGREPSQYHGSTWE